MIPIFVQTHMFDLKMLDFSSVGIIAVLDKKRDSSPIQWSGGRVKGSVWGIHIPHDYILLVFPI